MKQLPMNALRAFAIVYREGGIRPAARRLEVSHSSVSRHLREIEAWIGTELIDRDAGGRQLVFTAQGARLGETVWEALSKVQAVTESLREQRPGNAVLVDTTPSFAARWLLPRLPALTAALPWVEVSVVVDQRQRKPREHGCDLSIRMGAGPWSDGVAMPLMDDALVPVASAAYWDAHRRPRDARDFAGHTLLHDRDPNASWQMWCDRYGPMGLDVRQGRRFGSSDLLLRAAEQGMGVALVHRRLARESLANGLLEAAFEDFDLPAENAYWIITAQRHKRAAVKALVDWLTVEAHRA